jgi:hypothetical protein
MQVNAQIQVCFLEKGFSLVVLERVKSAKIKTVFFIRSDRYMCAQFSIFAASLLLGAHMRANELKKNIKMHCKKL